MLAQFSVTRAPGLLGSKADRVQTWPFAIIKKNKKINQDITETSTFMLNLTIMYCLIVCLAHMHWVYF